MRFTETHLPGAFLVDLKRIEDERGFFARGWCADEFAQHGLVPAMTQLNVGFSHKRGSLRGLHYQEHPHQEAKFVRCTRGAIFDVIVDLRPDSPTHGQWLGAGHARPPFVFSKGWVMPENHCCLVPVFDILGPCSVELMEHWAKSEGVELRRMWDDRLAVSVDDARMVYDRAMAAAEAARRKRLRVSGDGYT